MPHRTAQRKAAQTAPPIARAAIHKSWCQSTLPARVHHCMRSLGRCEMLVQLMMARAAERRAFGRMVIDYDTVQRWITEARVGIEQARLLTLRCAWLLDRDGHQGAWRDVSLVKIAVPNLLQTIADRAIQVFGAMGGSDDTPIHQALAWGRLLRIGDGPDEVHYRQIFKMGPPAPWSVAESLYVMAAPVCPPAQPRKPAVPAGLTTAD